MRAVKFKGTDVNVGGECPQVGSACPDFSLTKSDLSDVGLAAYQGKKKVLNIFPSIDTGTCAASVRQFHQKLSGKEDVVVLNISMDLPFAQSRFCGAEGIQNAETLSSFRSRFGEDFGLMIMDGPLKGLLARTVLVLSEDNTVLHCEQVAEITEEPNYETALSSLS